MAETDKKDAPPKDAEPKEKEDAKPSQPPPPMWMRALLGTAGLSLLVGFFLPWVRVPAVEEGAAATFNSGLDLAFSTTGIEGTPAIIVLVVPVLGALLSAIAFMGLRYAAQTAVGVAVGIIGYALYVLGSMFVQNTSFGLWVVSGGTFVTLLLGVTTWMLARRAADAAPVAKAKAPEPSKK
jgi:hypothetical protein